MDRWRRRGWSRAQIAAAAGALAARLHADGVGAGDRVGLYLQDGPLWIAGFFGVLRCGGVAVPVDVSHSRDLVRELAGELGLAAWVTEAELPRVETGLQQYELGWRPPPAAGATGAGVPWPDSDPDRLAQVVLTSGTTHRPRPVEITHRNLRTVLDALADEIERYRWAFRVAPRLRIAVTLPFSHLYGQMMGVLLPPLLEADVAAVATLPAHELARALRREGAWALAAVPHGLQSLADHLIRSGRERWGRDGLERRLERADGRPWPLRWLAFAPLRRQLGRRLVAVVSGGASLEPDLEAAWRRLGYLVVQGYGLTEAAPVVTLNHPFHPAAGSIGKPLPGVEVRLADDGEILVRGGNVASPTVDGPRIDDDGWLHTGDLGRRADDGTIRFVGRKSDRIVTPAGVNVDPDDVVAELRREEGVADAAVLERPRGERGVVSAVLVLEPGGDAREAVGAANGRLPDAARVRDWHVWPRGDLPRTPTGKPRRGELTAWLRQEAGEQPPTRDAAGEEAAGAGVEARHGTPDRGGDPDVQAVLEKVLELTRRRDPEDPEAAATATAGGRGRPSASTTLGEALTSMQRVDLAAALEDILDVSLGDPVFDGDRTLGELARELVEPREPADAGTVEERETAEERRPAKERKPADERTPAEAGTAAGDREPMEGARPGERPGERPGSRRASPRDRGAERVRPAPGPVRRAPRTPEVAWRHWPPTRMVRWLLREVVMRPLASSFVRLDVGGDGVFRDVRPPFVLAANHVSMMDPVLLFALPRDVRARVAPAARWNWFTARRTGGFWYRLGVLGMDLMPLLQTGDWRRSLRIGGRIADRGGCILIYPEGSISPDGEPRSFRSGVALISRELHLPIVPVGTHGLRQVLPRGHRWPRRGLRRPRVGVRFGEALSPVGPDDDLGAVTRELETRVHRLHREARATADGLG